MNESPGNSAFVITAIFHQVVISFLANDPEPFQGIQAEWLLAFLDIFDQIGRLRLLVHEPRLGPISFSVIAVSAENLRGVGYLRILTITNFDDKTKPRIEFGRGQVFRDYNRVYTFCDHLNRSRIHPFQSRETLIDKLPRSALRQTERFQLRRLLLLDPFANGIPRP